LSLEHVEIASEWKCCIAINKTTLVKRSRVDDERREVIQCYWMNMHEEETLFSLQNKQKDIDLPTYGKRLIA